MRRSRRLAAAATAVLALAMASAAPALASAKHDCAAVAPPGDASCMAMRLLLGTGIGTANPATAKLRQGVTAGKPYPGFLTPERLHAAYQLPQETIDGSTQTIALVDAFDDPTAEADLAVYDQQFGLPACTSENGCFKKIDEEGKTSPLPEVEGGWASEISIDVQMAHAICQSCHILLVEAKSESFADLGAAVNAAAKAGANEISNSYAGTESRAYESLAADYDHPGVVVAAASGDCGYLNKLCAERAAGANFPADDGDVLAVGGTTLSESAGVWKSTVWEEGGSGCSTIFSAPLWQSEVADFAATGCGQERAIADVAAIGDPNTGVDVYDSTPEEPGGPTGWGVWGGTSVASPIVAAEFALAGGANGVAFPAATLYAHAGEAQALYDVTSGSNGSCGGATICKAASGYDGPSGVGSPIGLEAFALPGVPESVSAPTVSGADEQGDTLTAHAGEWTGAPTTFAYQWQRCNALGANCAAIAGATAATYVLGAADVGETVRVREDAHNSTGWGAAYSASTAKIASDVPTVTGFSPSSGITGSTVTIEGTALDTTTKVLVGSLPASFTIVSPTRLEVVVPNGESKGKIQVTTAHGSATSKGKFTATLSIKSFKPTSAAAGKTISIKGVGFDSSSTVSFNGVPAASVTYQSSSKLKAVVPAGATSGPILVTNTASPAGTVASPESFTP